MQCTKAIQKRSKEINSDNIWYKKVERNKKFEEHQKLFCIFGAPILFSPTIHRACK